MKLNEKSKKTLLHSKNLDVEVKKKGEDLKKLREISSSIMNEKNSLLVINNLSNKENFDKIDQMLQINKKKTLKPVEHPILLKEKSFNEKTKDPTIFKLNTKNQNKLNNQEEIQITKIENITGSISNKSINSLTEYDSDQVDLIDENQLKKNSNVIGIDLKSIKNIDLRVGKETNDSFFDNKGVENFKENQNDHLMNLSDKNFNSMNNTNKSKWNFDKNLLDDSDFRKTHIIKEKLEIVNIPEKPINNINYSRIKSVKISQNSLLITSPKKENFEKNANHKKVNSMIFIENKENETIRDLTNEMNNNLENSILRSRNNTNTEPKNVIILIKFRYWR